MARFLICRYMNITRLSNEMSKEAALEKIPWIERRERILQHRQEADQWRMIGAGLLAAYSLALAGAKDLTIAYQSYGKPVLANNNDLHFNLSHSGEYTACAVSDARTGVDIERPRKTNAGVARRCFCAEDQKWVSEAPDPNLAFLRLWVRLESFLKLRGTGISEADSRFPLRGNGVPGFDITFSDYEVNGHLLCVCGTGDRHADFIELLPEEL